MIERDLSGYRFYDLMADLPERGRLTDATRRLMNALVEGIIRFARICPSTDSGRLKGAAFGEIEVFCNQERQHSTLGYESPVPFLKTKSETNFRKSTEHKILPWQMMSFSEVDCTKCQKSIALQKKSLLLTASGH